MPKIKINIFGEGIEIRRLYLPNETITDWKEFAARKQSSLSEKLIDPFFFYDLKDPFYKSIDNIKSNSISGMLDAPKNQLEIWFDRKKVLKWNASDLFNEMVLFPLFQIQKEDLSKEFQSGITILQKERGQLATLELFIEEEKLNIDDILFSITSGLGFNLLSEISHKNNAFKFIKKETLITSQSVFEFH